MNVFSLKTGFIKVDAQKAGEYLEEVNTEYGGITPEVLVEKGKEKDNILHNYFEWNNEKAGEKYRLIQASTLIANITVKYIADDKEEKQTRAFVHVSYSKDEKTCFRPVHDAMKNEYSRNIILKEAERDAKTYIAKYESLKEIQDIIIPMKNKFAKV